MDDGEAIVGVVEAFAATGDETKLGEDEAAESGVGGVVGELDGVLRGEVADVERGVKDDRAVGESLGALDDVKFVVNLADHLLEDVFDGDEAEDAAELVHDHGQTDTARTKLEKELAGELALGDDEDFAKDAAEAEVGRG